VKYHSGWVDALTPTREPGGGPWLVGSLTGAVASERVTEASKGALRPNGNRPERATAARALDCEADQPSRAERRA
jgi:Family of unknown function (DUF6467)